MSRKKHVFFAVIVTVGVLTAILLIPPSLNPEQVEFQGDWVVSVGETYQFEIDSWGGFTFGDYSDSEVSEILSLDGTVINVTITNLPTLDFAINRITFENEIVTVQKISCVFSNGSEIPTNSKRLIVEAISGCILPVGSWPILNSYHSTWDQMYGQYLDDYYFSELLDDSFQFGHLSSYIDDEKVWNGTISLDTGFPSLVSWYYWHMYPSAGIHLELTQI